MSLLTWNFDKNFIYVIIYWILEIVYRLILYLKREFFDITNQIVIDKYIFVILDNISALLSGFLILYIKSASKSKKIENKKNVDPLQPQLIHTNSIKKKKNFYIKLIIVAVLNYISRSSVWLSFAIANVDRKKVSFNLQKNITITLDILMRYIFSVFILKIIIYKHRIFSMITIGIGLAILIINDIISMHLDKLNSYNFEETFFYTAIASISGFIYPLEDTFIKQIFLDEYLYPANLQFYRGIAELILIAVITPILFFSFGLKLSFNSKNLEGVIPTIIISTLASFVKDYITLKIIYHYSSQSVSFLIISISFGCSIAKFIDIFRNYINDKWKIIFILLEIISIIIILFASLVYDEIIIINKWRFNENVKIGIIYRGELEMENMSNLRDSQLDDIQLVDNDNDNNERNSVNSVNIESNKNDDNKE